MVEHIEIRDAVYDEYFRAQELHRPMASHHEAKSVIEEEFDEYWELVKLNPRKPMIHPTKGYPLSVGARDSELRTELIQIAAMCMRALRDCCKEE